VEIIMPCGLMIKSSIELELYTPMEICSICENFDCKKRMGQPEFLKKLAKSEKKVVDGLDKETDSVVLPEPNEGEKVTKGG